jgi:hypothetical protein
MGSNITNKNSESGDFFQEASINTQENKLAFLSNVPSVEIKELQIEDKSK